jgi:hypothetical protein
VKNSRCVSAACYYQLLNLLYWEMFCNDSKESELTQLDLTLTKDTHKRRRCHKSTNTVGLVWRTRSHMKLKFGTDT